MLPLPTPSLCFLCQFFYTVWAHTHTCWRKFTVWLVFATTSTFRQNHHNHWHLQSVCFYWFKSPITPTTSQLLHYSPLLQFRFVVWHRCQVQHCLEKLSLQPCICWLKHIEICWEVCTVVCKKIALEMSIIHMILLKNIIWSRPSCIKKFTLSGGCDSDFMSRFFVSLKIRTNALLLAMLDTRSNDIAVFWREAVM